MGIRTIGFEKVARNQPATNAEKIIQSDVKALKKEETSVKEESVVVSKKKESCVASTSTQPVVVPKLDDSTSTSVKKAVTPPPPPAPVKADNCGGRTRTGSPVKKTTPASMARLGGIKAAARKIKKQRKRRLFVRASAATATTKILRNNSIKGSKPIRRSFRVAEENSRETKTLPSRVSTRMCVRRSSREGIPEAPLRTVELIKRPVELREPATKLLFMASLGLYPDPGDSDMSPIVVIKELTGSPGKKNGIRKSLELPLMPFHKRILDGTQPKRPSLESIKPAAKSSKRESQKTSPVPKVEKQTTTKKVEIKKEKTPTPSPPALPQGKISGPSSLVANDYTKAIYEVSRKKSPVNGFIKSLDKSLDLTIATGKLAAASPSPPPPIVHDSGKANSISKSLLKNNLSPPTMSEMNGIPFPLPSLNGISTIPMHNGIGKLPTLPTTTLSVADAMNLIMSSITILPAPVNSNSTNSSRKRRSNNTFLPNLSTKVMEAQAASTINGIYPIHFDEKPPRKKQRNNQEVNSSRFSLPVSTVNVSKPSPPQSQPISFAQPPPMPYQSENEEALNLCVKRPPPVPVIKTPPPKLQNKTPRNETKGNASNGPRPLNLIIPRPPPLTKAPLDLANLTNGSFSQNVHPIQQKSKAKKPRKPRVNNNQRIQSAMQQLPLLPPLTSHLVASAENAVHAKSLLKCMNGEENSCARGVGETLDSVKTMLARLQTSIGPAVNGVRLITIE